MLFAQTLVAWVQGHSIARKIAIGLLLAAAVASAQSALPYRISTIAGSGAFRFAGEGRQATEVRLIDPIGAARDSAGNVYVADRFFGVVLRVAPNGTISRFAGAGDVGFSGDGGPALDAQLNRPGGIAVDAAGNVYVADAFNHRIRRIAPDGTITTVAGNGAGNSLGDGGQALAVSLFFPGDLALDRERNLLYIAERDTARIRRLDLNTGVIDTVAGNGMPGDSGEGGPATDAMLNAPTGVGLMSDGSLLIADSRNFKVKRVALDGVITTVAGTGQPAINGDGGPATEASIGSPVDADADPAGNIFVAVGPSSTRMISPAGVISSVPNTTHWAYLLPVAASDVIGVVNFQRRLQRLSQGLVTDFAGVGNTTAVGDGGVATSAKLLDPLGLAVDSAGAFYVGDFRDQRVRRVRDGVIDTLGAAQGEAIAIDSQGRILAVTGTQVFRFEADGARTVVAGTGVPGTLGDGGLAVDAQLNFSQGIAVDARDNVYIGESHGNRIRRVDAASGLITTIVGTGVAGDSGDGGPATQAELNFPSGLAFGPDGELFIADTNNNRIRVLGTDGVIRPFAGSGAPGLAGDGGPADQAELSLPYDVDIDASGAVYISSNIAIRKVGPDGIISTIAGNGTRGFSGDGGPSLDSMLSSVQGIDVDPGGVVRFVDRSNLRVRQLEPVHFTAQSVVHSANFQATPIAPGQIISIFGVEIGPAEAALAGLGADGLLLTTVGGVQVLFNGTPGPIFFAGQGQLNVQVPYEIVGAAKVTVEIIVSGMKRNSVEVAVASSAPGIYALAGGTGQIVAFNQDGTLNGPAIPARPGEVIVFFASGHGQTDPPGRTGMLAQDPFPAPVLETVVEMGGQPGQILFAAGAPGFAGLMQVNVVVPPNAPTGAAVSILLRVGSNQSAVGTTIAIAQ